MIAIVDPTEIQLILVIWSTYIKVHNWKFLFLFNHYDSRKNGLRLIEWRGFVLVYSEEAYLHQRKLMTKLGKTANGNARPYQCLLIHYYCRILGCSNPRGCCMEFNSYEFIVKWFLVSNHGIFKMEAGKDIRWRYWWDLAFPTIWFSRLIAIRILPNEKLYYSYLRTFTIVSSVVATFI